MITYQEESFERAIGELQAVIPLHWNELALFKDKMPLAPRWDEYVVRERNGSLLFATARLRGDLVAYYIAFVSCGLHYGTTLTANMDIMYVHPDHRNHGTGVRLFRFVEKCLKARGAKLWYSGHKVHADFGMPKLLRHCGFAPADVYMVKWLGADQ